MNTKTLRLVESAVMLALATVLSLVSIYKAPYGGSVTPASMLPIIIIAYRYGPKWGLLTGFAHALLQQLFDISYLSWATSFWAVMAIVLLDYLVAFSALGFAGILKAN